MYKRRFTFVLICLLSFAAASQNLSAQSQLAQDTYAIFEASCLNCHGPDGAFRETLLMEHSELIDGGTVVPANPDASELYKRLLGPTENGAQMPFGLPQLPAQSIETVRRWILAGAPAWTTTRITDGRFISPAEILDTIETHLNSLSSFDRAFARYFTLTHLYNAGETAEILGEYRKALNKLVNSLSWGITVTNPQPIDSLDTIFYIDLRHYEWDRIDAWTKIEEAYPYHISFDAPTQTSLHDQLGRLQTQMKCDVPSVHIDWFIATASTQPLYHELLALPSTARELELQLDVDVVGNLQNAPGVRVWRAGFNNSGVSNHNRVVERHTSRYGAYWKSYDFAGSVGTQNILTHPLNFTHDGGEVIFNLPNGLQGYYLVDGNGLRLDEAPISIVSNPAASDPTVRNGISCIGCHTEGMKTFEDHVRSVIQSNANPNYNKAQALRLYAKKTDMDALVGKDMEKYRAALAATGGVFGGVEPVSRFHEAFHAPVDAPYAAAVVGLETETFLEGIRENSGLQNVGLLVLEGENGSVQRDTWTSRFRDIIHALDYPHQIVAPPIVTQPDVLPGTHVHIPDPTLSAIISEELGKNSNAPITVEEMETLITLESQHRRIHNLTGLQFATNLTHLDLDNSRVSDISPLKGLTNLKLLQVHGSFSDLSPVTGLINLEFFDFSGSNVSDLSPLVGLVNLRKIIAPEGTKIVLPPAVLQGGFIHIPDPNLRAVIEDALGTKAITPSAMETLTTIKASDRGIFNLAGLEYAINLEELWLSDNPVSDLSPLAGCTNLIRLFLWDARVENLSPLANLTRLEVLEHRGGNISDISPLAGLTNLRVLWFYNADVSDISAVSGMTKLEKLGIRHSPVEDITPLAGLVNLEVLNLHDCHLSDISPLGNLTKLREIAIDGGGRGHRISDLSPLSRLTNLQVLDIGVSKISDLSALEGLTQLRKLIADANEISNLSPLAGRTNLVDINLSANKISDVSPLAGLTNLRVLNLSNNLIHDMSPLTELSNNATIVLYGNPGFRGGPKIEGPWLWIVVAGTRLDSGSDLLASVSGTTVTEQAIATHGATEGQAVGDDVWTAHRLPPTGNNNIREMLKLPNLYGVVYGAVSIYSPRRQDTTMYIGNDEGVKVWLNGVLVYEVLKELGTGSNYEDYFPVTLRQGRNVLLVAVFARGPDTGASFGLDQDTDYTALNPGVNYVFSETPIHVDDTFTLDIRGENVFNLAGWQFDIVFDPVRLEAVGVSEGDFLKSNGGTTFFQSGRIDNAAGKITGLIAGRISEGGASGSGSLLQVEFKAESEGETELALEDFEFGSISGENIPAGPLEIRITVAERLVTGDVNRDGRVSILDLILVAQQLGSRVPPNSAVDINGDGMVNIFDLTLVAQGIAGAAAPAIERADNERDRDLIETWITLAQLEDDGSIAFRQGIANLQILLDSLIVPQETALHANYPNPFNPETWIPYQLAASAEVVLTIYDMNGGVVRRLEMGHQTAGMYRNRNRAAYWDGRNQRGESVASGLYFYTLKAREFVATRKMLIRK